MKEKETRFLVSSARNFPNYSTNNRVYIQCL